jgi:S-adenosylmethionine:tRNA-ribosyltransferase-isomerase (queuine synthetase)
MMVVHRDRKKIAHAHFVDLKQFLRDDDLLVLNNSRVLPARHFSDDGNFEFLFLEKTAPCRWKVLVKPSRRFGKGAATVIQGMRAEAGEIFEDGSREIALSDDIDLQRCGAMPLPPYIKRPVVIDRRYRAEDEARYQTVFAKYEGSLAAATFSLRFTSGRQLFVRLKWKTSLNIKCIPSDFRFRRMQPRQSRVQSASSRSEQQQYESWNRFSAVSEKFKPAKARRIFLSIRRSSFGWSMFC